MRITEIASRVRSTPGKSRRTHRNGVVRYRCGVFHGDRIASCYFFMAQVSVEVVTDAVFETVKVNIYEK